MLIGSRVLLLRVFPRRAGEDGVARMKSGAGAGAGWMALQAAVPCENPDPSASRCSAPPLRFAQGRTLKAQHAVARLAEGGVEGGGDRNRQGVAGIHRVDDAVVP